MKHWKILVSIVPLLTLVPPLAGAGEVSDLYQEINPEAQVTLTCSLNNRDLWVLVDGQGNYDFPIRSIIRGVEEADLWDWIEAVPNQKKFVLFYREAQQRGLKTGFRWLEVDKKSLRTTGRELHITGHGDTQTIQTRASGRPIVSLNGSIVEELDNRAQSRAMRLKNGGARRQ